MTELQFEQARKICLNLLEVSDSPVSAEKISQAITKVKVLFPEISKDEEKSLFERVESFYGISMDEARILDEDYKSIVPWIEEKRAREGINWKFWKRYREYLSEEKSFSPLVVARLNDLTDKIMDRLEDPSKQQVFDRRGMVVGHVQSGKTSNYIGLMCKAADAGYKLIIVLTGVHNSLRSQTQLRIDEGFLGYDTQTSRSFSQTNNRIGVGKIDRTASAHSLTSSTPAGDFRRAVAETVNFSLRGDSPVVLVIKKNNSVLKNVINWLAAKEGEQIDGTNLRAVRGIPMLLIDDEADNASINISRGSVSSINGSIRALLKLFNQSAYVGYTATPYANIFIEPPDREKKDEGKGIKFSVADQQYEVGDDLFPRNFIINLPAPSNYIGPERIFGIVSSENLLEAEESALIPLYRIVRDHQPADYFDSPVTVDEIRHSNINYIPDKHFKDDQKPEDIPDSLKRAIRCFILSCAARRARGFENVHNSMLVHVTRFVDWQNVIAKLVHIQLDKYRILIEYNNPEFLESLRELWEEEYVPTTERIINDQSINDRSITRISWEELKVHIFHAVTKIQVRAVHGSVRGAGLDSEILQPFEYYDHKRGLSVIAVGGNKLSRGLTLEGLSISYYLRSSKMYDTLMQMGRWFGYRGGYLDLCRLFTSEELVSFYRHITVVTQEMRAEFDRMYVQRLQPIDFGLKIRTHTGALVITASNKFRYKKIMSFSYSGELEETYKFNRKRKDHFQENFIITKDFLTRLGDISAPRNNYALTRSQPFVWYKEDNWAEIVDYIRSYRTSQKSFITSLIADYIEKQATDPRGYLRNWTVVCITNSNTREEDKVHITEKVKVGLSFRKDTTKDSTSGVYDGESEWYEITKAHIIGNFHEFIDLNDTQLSIAIKQTQEDKELQGLKGKKVEQPSTLRIRTNRSESNGLLLIYPLDPKPDLTQPPYSTDPIIGLAISFPYIKDDNKIEYAVNKVFEEALMDYPLEFDNEDAYGDEHLDSDSTRIQFVPQMMTAEKFESFIEEDLYSIDHFDDTELTSGVTYEKLDAGTNPETVPTKTNIVIPLSFLDNPKYADFQPFPFLESSEIKRYITPKVFRSYLINPEESESNDEKVFGLKTSKYVTFTYSKGKIYVPETLWVLKTKRYSSRFITALMNSTLFGAWVRICGQRKKERYFISNSVILSFPIITPNQDKLSLIEKLVNFIMLTAEMSSSEAGNLRVFYQDVLDALIFTIYFPKSMATTHEILLRNFSVDTIGKDENLDTIQDLYRSYINKNHEVRQELYFIDKYEKVKIVKDIFTERPDEN